MNEREKLMELIVDAENEAHKFFPYLECMKRIEETAAYLLEHGVLMPPVNVGDIVYIIYCEKVYPVLVCRITSDNSEFGNRIQVENELKIDESTTHWYSTRFKWESMGKSFFISREEAMKALEERKSAKNGS